MLFRAGTIAEIDEKTENLRDLCVEARKENKGAKIFYKEKYTCNIFSYLELSLTLLFDWTSRIVQNDAFQTLKRKYELDVARKHALLTVMLKK